MKCKECKETLKQASNNSYYCISSLTMCSQSTKIVYISDDE